MWFLLPSKKLMPSLRVCSMVQVQYAVTHLSHREVSRNLCRIYSAFRCGAMHLVKRTWNYDTLIARSACRTQYFRVDTGRAWYTSQCCMYLLILFHIHIANIWSNYCLFHARIKPSLFCSNTLFFADEGASIHAFSKLSRRIYPIGWWATGAYCSNKIIGWAYPWRNTFPLLYIRKLPHPTTGWTIEGARC